MRRRARKNIEEQEWYHGYRPRKDIMRLLREPGDFLVRATDTGQATEIVLSACDENKKVVNLTLRVDDSKWYVGAATKDPAKISKIRKFPSIVDLVEYYRSTPLSKRLPLKRPIVRPQWLVKHENVVFDSDKDKLGSGNFCIVYKGKHRLKDGDVRIVAVKMSIQSTLNDHCTDEAIEARKSMIHEAQIMSFYEHDNVIKLFGVACDHPPVLVVMEFCPGGDLQSHLRKHGDDIETAERILYCGESARGMAYLHSKQCVHRDLAARNCLISDRGHIKIADFGMSRLFVEGEPQEGDAKAQVPLRWMAPETLKKPPVFSVKSDVWAHGVMIYEIFSNGSKPWPSDPPKMIATAIRRGNMPALPEKTPPKIKEIVPKLWNVEPDKRPSFHSISSFMKDLVRSTPMPTADKLVLNRIPGVTRSVVTHDDSTEMEETSSRCSTDNTDNTKGSIETVSRTRKTTTNSKNLSKNRRSIKDDTPKSKTTKRK